MRITEAYLRNVIQTQLKVTLVEMQMGGGKSIPILEKWKVEGNKVIPIDAYYSMEQDLPKEKRTPIPPIPLDNMTKGQAGKNYGGYTLMRFVEGSKPITYILIKIEDPQSNAILDKFVAANPM